MIILEPDMVVVTAALAALLESCASLVHGDVAPDFGVARSTTMVSMWTTLRDRPTSPLQWLPAPSLLAIPRADEPLLRGLGCPRP